jgi:hypothetical protein
MAIVLYLMVFFEYPFWNKAVPQDKKYKEIMKEDYVKYWSMQNGAQNVSDDLKDLLIGMLGPEDRRFNLEKIENHNWMKGNVPDDD